MSDRIATIRRKGEERRATWSPRAEGVPLKWYQWWQRQTGYETLQENFCHYWRVVLIWAPLLGVRLAGKRILSFKTTQAALLVCVVGMAILMAIVYNLTLNLGMIYVFLGFAFGIRHYEAKTGRRSYPAVLPVWYVTLRAILLPAVAFGYGLSYLCYDSKLAHWVRVHRYDIGEFFWTVRHVGMLLLAAVGIPTIVGFIGFMLYEEVSSWQILLVLVAGLTVVGGAIVFWTFREDQFYHYVSRPLQEVLYVVVDHTPAGAKRVAGVVYRPFRPVVAFVTLIAQVIRVTKWRICPLVEIPPVASE